MKFAFDCTQCGDGCDELREGVCVDCCKENQAELDTHNFEYDWWGGLSNSDRADEISNAIRRES